MKREKSALIPSLSPSLPSHSAFAALRLHQFVDSAEIHRLKDWKYMDEDWLGEAIGFTEFLRLKRDARRVRSVSIDLLDLPAGVQRKLLDAVGLLLRKGITLDQVVEVLGAPAKVEIFAADRKTYSFRLGTRWQYDVTCTIRHKGGLCFVTMMNPERFPRS